MTYLKQLQKDQNKIEKGGKIKEIQSYIEVMLNKIKNLQLHYNVSYHRFFYQNRFINEYAKRKKDNIP